MYFIKWLTLTEDFFSNDLVDKDSYIQKEWLKENLIKIEQDFLSDGFSKEDSSEDLGWILLKDKIDGLPSDLNEQGWIKTFSYYEGIETMRRVLNSESDVESDEVIKWAKFISNIQLKDQSCFNYLNSVHVNDNGTLSAVFSMFPSEDIVFVSNSIRLLRESIETIFKNQPSEFTYIEAFNFLKNKTNNNTIYLEDIDLNNFWK